MTACRRACAHATSRGRRRGTDLLLVDTSGLIALVDRGHEQHDAVIEIVGSERGPFCVSPFVLQETDYLVSQRLGPSRSWDVLDSVASGAYEIEAFGANDIAVAVALMRRYADMPVGLADASIVVLGAKHGTERVLTLDERHFRAIRPLQGGAFTVLPADV